MFSPHPDDDVISMGGTIRRGEARTACTYNEIPLDHVHFLDLPFYESGKIEKLPMTEKDAEVARALLQKVQPHQIYVAGDLADPHGTHKKCTDADNVFAKIGDVQKTAILLFAEYIDAATTIAAQSGGGGGGATSGWGRDKGEDELSWAHRCAMMANRL